MASSKRELHRAGPERTDTHRKAWSLRRRLIGWITAGVAVLLVSGSVFTTWFMGDALRREIESIVMEESAELFMMCRDTPIDRGAIEEVARTLDAHHPDFWLSLRGWRGGAPEAWLIVGAAREEGWPVSPELGDGESAFQDKTLRRTRIDIPMRPVVEEGATEDSAPPQEVVRFELMIDGGLRAEEMARASSAFHLLMLLGGMIAIASGAYFSSKVSRLLTDVAESAALQRLNEPAAGLAPMPRAPDEIHRVVEAFRGSVAQMRSEHARNVLLTAGLAHELRSPLQNAISDAEVMLLRDRTQEEYRAGFDRQLLELREFALVVDNLITLTALRDTDTLPRHETFNLAEEARLRFAEEATDAARRNVRVAWVDWGDQAIDGDREALILMLRNLVGNAIRWTKPGTEVRVTLDGRASDMVITVDDEGTGVDEAERELIFEPFRQGSSPSGGRTGYGLGLALARAAARSHGGTIAVADSPAGGARFEVSLTRDGEASGRASAN